ncbi:hypothetical protein ACIRF8_28380 [Streptomyces sp. NPDC102406]|uniref:hypothetical protein n=1 Tax=Streptomyces sp. NPDC102406 TaxID=3366171 RepID=UPI00380007AB
MHGHGFAPPPRLPSSGAQAGMRVLFVAIAVLTVGFLGFAPMLRLALTTRRKVDMRVFIAVAAVQLVCWAGVFSDPGGEEFTTWYGNTGMGLMLVNMVVSVTYYLVADIRHAHRDRPLAGPAMYGMPRAQQPYGYPQPQPQPQTQPYGQPRPQAPTPPMHAMPTQAAAPTPVPAPPPTAPRPQTPPQPPHRIDQVRAELDELSDYLRKREDGGR